MTLITSCVCVYIIIILQLLQFVNPTVRYKSNDKCEMMRPGVAVILKDLVSVLDQLNIEHPDESSIRRVLRQRKDVLTTANQRFLVGMSGAEKITKGNSHHYSCIIIPREDVPQTFFDKLEANHCKCIIMHVQSKITLHE